MLDRVRDLAKQIQDESLFFGCASALFGLTKYMYEKEKDAFLSKISKQKEGYRKELLSASKEKDSIRVNELSEALVQLDTLKESIQLKHFYMHFYDSTVPTRHLGTRLTVGKNEHFISLPDSILLSIIDAHERKKEDLVEVKNQQRKITAHEIAHELFRFIDGTERYPVKLDNESNAEEFANELLSHREIYINGLAKKKEES